MLTFAAEKWHLQQVDPAWCDRYYGTHWEESVSFLYLPVRERGGRESFSVGERDINFLS